jgi:hypothetical protein
LVAVLTALLLGAVFSAIATFLFVVITEAIVESLGAKQILKQDIASPGFGPGGNAGLTWLAIQIEPSGLTLRGTWAKSVFDPKPFEPKVWIVSETSAKRSPRPEEQDIYHDPGSAIIGCAPGDYTYTVTGFDTTTTLRIESQDVPLPLIFAPWNILIGRKPTAVGIMNGNPYPVFSGSPVRIQPPTVVSSADVLLPAPPFVGSIRHIDPIEIGAGGSDDTQWTLECHAEDGNMVIMVDTDVTDAGGRIWSLRNYVYAEGQSLTFGQDYYEHQKVCAVLMKEWARRNPSFAHMDYWTPIWDPENAIASHIYDSITQHRVGSVAMLQEQIVEFGEGFSDRVLGSRGVEGAPRD